MIERSDLDMVCFADGADEAWEALLARGICRAKLIPLDENC